MRKAEVINVITELKKIFEIVRLVDLETMKCVEIDETGEFVHSDKKCYEPSRIADACSKCPESSTCKNIRVGKFEFINGELYRILTKPITIDDGRFVLELIEKAEKKSPECAGDVDDYNGMIGALSKRVYIDPVTGILNRRYYEDYPETFKDKKAFALVDIDDFSDIYAVHGIAAGERILKKTVDIIKERIRKDDIFIHYGTDTFIIMFQDIEAETFVSKMNTIRMAAAEARSDEEGTRFTVSIGCVMKEGESPISFEDVDRQLYVAKRIRNAVAYRNKVIYSEGSSFSTKGSGFATVMPINDDIDFLQKNKKIIDNFMKEYSSVYVIDLDNDTVYVDNKRRICSVKTDSKKHHSVYSKKYKRYIDRYVADIDRDWMKHQLSIQKLRENLKFKGDLVYTYRVQLRGEEHFYRLRVVEIKETGKERFAILGFADRNREVVNELVMDSLMNDYHSIFVVDLKQNTIRTIKYDSSFPELNVENCNYFEFARARFKMIDKKFRGEFYRMAEPKYVQEAFRRINRRELIFKLASSNHAWEKITASVLERQNGEAVTMVYCFSDIDHYRVKELEYQKMIEKQEALLERTVRERTRELSVANRQLRKLNEQIVDFIGYVVEGRDSTSGKHIAKVKVYTAILASKVKNMLPEYGLTGKDVETIVAASPLHDVGKVAISDSILLKPGRLTAEEFETMKRHTTIGCEILKKAPKEWNLNTKEVAIEICRSHHERADGRGYPDGLKGDEIPISAQIVGIADCFDALTSERPYKGAFSTEKAFEMIINGECGVFSENILRCFIACKEDFIGKR